LEVQYHLTHQDTEYLEWEAGDIDRDVDDWQLLSLLYPDAPRVRLVAEAFDRSRISRDSRVEYCTPRSLDWLRYATKGFFKHQITLKILRPEARRMQAEDWAKWHFYLRVCRSLADTVIISAEEDEMSTYMNIILPTRAARGQPPALL
jgi:hypothetical protein